MARMRWRSCCSAALPNTCSKKRAPTYWSSQIAGCPTQLLPAQRVFPAPQRDPRLRGNCHLEHTIALIGEQIVGFFNLIEFEAVRHQRAGFQPPAGNDLHQATHALLATRAERGDDFVVAKSSQKPRKRNRQIIRINTE